MMITTYQCKEHHDWTILRININELLTPKDHLSLLKREEIISIYAFVQRNNYVYWTPRGVWIPHILIKSSWVYGFYNTETFETFEEVIVQEQVSVNYLRMIINSKIAVISVPMKANIKMNIHLSIPCDIERL